jgi:tetratricopeptide (TPR) repeat protein
VLRFVRSAILAGAVLALAACAAPKPGGEFRTPLDIVRDNVASDFAREALITRTTRADEPVTNRADANQPGKNSTAPEMAREMASRRRVTTMTLEQNLAKAMALLNEENHEASALLYEECVRLVAGLGRVNVPKQDRSAVEGLTRSRYAISRSYVDQRGFPEAIDQMDQLLRIVPNSSLGASYKSHINQNWVSFRGAQIRSATSGANSDSLEKMKKVAGLITDGKFLYEMRLLEEARKKLRQAIELDPQSKDAYDYLNLIARATPSSRRRQILLRKLNSIVIDELLFDDAPLSEVVKFLDKEVRKNDPDGTGINFIINPFLDDAPSDQGVSNAAPGKAGENAPDTVGQKAPLAPPVLDAFGQPIGVGPVGAIDVANVVISIDPPLRDLMLIDALDAITKTADAPIKFIVEDYAIVFLQKLPETPQLFTRVFKVDG